MTETTKKIKIRETYVIDPVAFFVALVGAPVTVAVLGFWAMFVPVAALILGAPFYLALGTPVLLWHLGRRPPEPGRIALLALVSFAIPAALVLMYFRVFLGPNETTSLAIMVGFGAVFAPLWGAVFGVLYRKLRREIFAHPV